MCVSYGTVWKSECFKKRSSSGLCRSDLDKSANGRKGSTFTEEKSRKCSGPANFAFI